MKTINCIRCGATQEYEPMIIGDREVFQPRYCYPCVSILETEQRAEDVQRAINERKAGWLRICPPLYQESNQHDPRLSSKVRDALNHWHPTNGHGIALVGRSGVGKTRLTFIRLQELYMAGMDVFACSAKKLERAFQQTWADDRTLKQNAAEIIGKARHSELLFLDDIGKEKFTDRVASDFYDLIEYRTAHKLTTVWTANSVASDLIKRMGDEHGAATVRRLIEFSTVVTA